MQIYIYITSLYKLLDIKNSIHILNYRLIVELQ